MSTMAHSISIFLGPDLNSVDNSDIEKACFVFSRANRAGTGYTLVTAVSDVCLVESANRSGLLDTLLREALPRT